MQAKRDGPSGPSGLCPQDSCARRTRGWGGGACKLATPLQCNAHETCCNDTCECLHAGWVACPQVDRSLQAVCLKDGRGDLGEVPDGLVPQAPLLRVEKNGGLPRQPAAVRVPACLAETWQHHRPCPSPRALAGGFEVNATARCSTWHRRPRSSSTGPRVPTKAGETWAPGLSWTATTASVPSGRAGSAPAPPDLEGCLVRHPLHHEGGQGVVDNSTHDSPRVPSALGELPPGGLPMQRAGIDPPVHGTCAAVPRKRPALT